MSPQGRRLHSVGPSPTAEEIARADRAAELAATEAADANADHLTALLAAVNKEEDTAIAQLITIGAWAVMTRYGPDLKPMLDAHIDAANAGTRLYAGRFLRDALNRISAP